MRSPASVSRAGAALLRGEAVGDVTCVSPPINSAGALVDGAPALLGEPHLIISLPLPPSANKSWRPGIGHGGHAAMFKRAPYKAWLAEAIWLVAAQVHGQMIPYRYQARIVLPETPRDPDNSVKPLQDALQRGGAIANDKHLRRMILEVDATRTMQSALIELWALADIAPKKRVRKAA